MRGGGKALGGEVRKGVGEEREATRERRVRGNRRER